MSGRDPFPPIKCENGFTLNGFRPQQTKTYNKPTHIAQTEEPWSRLHETATWASSRRSVTHYEHQATNDSLDFQLKSVYDHHKDFSWKKNQISYQKETVNVDHRKQENLKQDMLEKEQEKDIRMWVDPQRHFQTRATRRRVIEASSQHEASNTTFSNCYQHDSSIN